MYYHFDIISLMLFLAGCFVLWVKKWNLSARRRGLYGLMLLGFVYMIAGLVLTFRWHAQTGELFLRSFYEMDRLYFSALSLISGFMLLYFCDICIKNPKHVWAIFILPTLQVFYVLFINEHTGWYFYYVDGVYHRGPLLFLSYLLWISYTATMIVLTIRHRTKLGQKAVVGIMLFFAFEIGVQVYQTIVMETYIGGGLAYATGVLFLLSVPMLLAGSTDDLTNISNRKGFEMAVSESIKFHKASSNSKIIAVDIYNFKNINERFGFEGGNKVLKHIALHFTKMLPEDAEIARFDSDRFFIYIPKGDVELPFKPINIQDCIPEEEESYEISFFMGIYNLSEDDTDVRVMCDRAAFALNRVKGDYHRRYAFFDSQLEHKLSMQSYIIHEMKHSLENEAFQVYFQPIFDANTLEMVSGEALVRWKDQNYGMIPPNAFIPLFEQNGFINELDTFVCNRVCDYIKSWHAQGLKSIPISVNLSRVDLLSPSFLKVFTGIMKNHGLSSKDVRLEITESAFVHTEDFRSNLDILHDIGYKVMMDDFGSGYSNFNTFAGMPVDILKVDMGFMDTMKKTRRGEKVISTIADMAINLDMPIVAEGVETEEQLEYLKSVGISYVQGYLLARPMPYENFEKLIRKHQMD